MYVHKGWVIYNTRKERKVLFTKVRHLKKNTHTNQTFNNSIKKNIFFVKKWYRYLLREIYRDCNFRKHQKTISLCHK